MRVAVLGAASFSTPHLARYLAQRNDIAPVTIVLAGRTPDRLAAIGRASRILAEGSLVEIEMARAADGDWRQCLAGAELVIVQVRIGGYDARRYDETFPLEFDLCGDEGLGAGGLAAAWRSWPVLRDILNDARAICPSAAIFVLTSPVSLLVRMARSVFPELDISGICELPFTTLCGIAQREEVRWDELEWDYLGINHIGWLYGVGRSRRRSPVPIPLKYLRLEDARSEVLAEQKARPGKRACQLAALAPMALNSYARCGRDGIERALSVRLADWYDAAIGPLIASRAGGRVNAPFFLSVPQGCWSPDFEPDDVLEIPHVIAHGLARRRARTAAPPPELARRLLRFVRYERAASEAVATRDRDGIVEALALHPWVPQSIDLRALTLRVCAT